METKPILLPEQDINFQINSQLLRSVLWRRGIVIALAGLLAGGAYTYRQLYSAPQQYMAECSVVIQTNNSPGIPTGLSALFGGGGGGSHKYMGLLASRMMADKVERRLKFTEKMHLGDKKYAADLLRSGLKADDTSFEGLLLLRFTMDAPPIMSAGARAEGEKTRLEVADVANAYAAELSRFYSESSSESANALLDVAEEERQTARENYQQATSRLRNFVATWRDMPVQGTPAGNNVESNGAGELLNLYSQIEAIDADVEATHVAQETSKKLRDEQLKNVRILPAEDGLLNSARNAVTLSELNLKHVSDTYGVDHPTYKDAVDNLRRAKEEFARQTQGLRKLQTSDQMELRKNIAVQATRRAIIMKQIAKGENYLFSRRDMSWRMEQLRAAQGIALQLMQAAEVKAVDIRLSTLTGKNKMSVLDKALPPDTNIQGNASPTRTAIIVALLAMMLVTAAEYMRAMRRQSLNAYQFALSNAGLMNSGLPTNNSNGNDNGLHTYVNEQASASNGGNGNGSHDNHDDSNANGSSNGNGSHNGAISANGNGNNSSNGNGGKSPVVKTPRRR